MAAVSAAWARETQIKHEQDARAERTKQYVLVHLAKKNTQPLPGSSSGCATSVGVPCSTGLSSATVCIF